MSATDLRRRVLTLASVLLFAGGLWILNGACSFALGSTPPPELVSEFRAAFYQRAGLGVSCILLGITLLRLRRARPGEKRKGPGA